MVSLIHIRSFVMELLHVMQVRERVAAGAFPLNKFVITKQLTKRPEDYPDAKNQPHVQVALRRKAAGAQNGVMQARIATKCSSASSCTFDPLIGFAYNTLLLRRLCVFVTSDTT